MHADSGVPSADSGTLGDNSGIPAGRSRIISRSARNCFRATRQDCTIGSLSLERRRLCLTYGTPTLCHHAAPIAAASRRVALRSRRFLLHQFEFVQALNEKHNGRAAHVGARAELEAVTSQIMLDVRQLDALNRFFFRNDAESLAAWKSARDVAWPLPPKEESPAGGDREQPAA